MGKQIDITKYNFMSCPLKGGNYYSPYYHCLVKPGEKQIYNGSLIFEESHLVGEKYNVAVCINGQKIGYPDDETKEWYKKNWNRVAGVRVALMPGRHGYGTIEKGKIFIYYK